MDSDSFKHLNQMIENSQDRKVALKIVQAEFATNKAKFEENVSDVLHTLNTEKRGGVVTVAVNSVARDETILEVVKRVKNMIWPFM